MQEKDLQKTRQKLTLQFVGVVFLIAFFLEVLFFSFRFFHELSESQKTFASTTTKILSDIQTRETLIQKGIQPEIVEFMDKAFAQKRGPRSPDENLVSYLAVDEKNRIVERSLKEDINLSILLEDHGYGIYREDQTFIRKEKLVENTYYFYRKITYSMTDYFSDIFVFTSFLFLFSVGFYMIGLQFVSKTLKPVEDNLKDMRDFIHNAGHELKTPLAVMRGNLQIMQAEKKFDTDLLSQSIKEVDRMNSLIEGLRELSEVGKNSEKFSLALATEIATLIKEYQKLADEKAVTLENTVTGKFIVQANREELSVLLGNLLQNAIKYNKKGGKVTLELTKNILTIRDTGRGIPSSEQEKIWERFFQGSSARSGEGFGIGLSLVKKIADNHGWQLKVKSEEEKGTVFQVIF